MKVKYKRLFLFIATLLPALCAGAQQKGYEMGYERAHYFYRMGDELSIVDMDMEWPRHLEGAEVAPLCRYMTKVLFGEENVSLRAATERYLQRFGRPVDNAFDSMPDDRKYCHVDIGSRLIGYERGRYASFQLTLTQRPQPASSQQPREVSRLLTYDLKNGRVMEKNEVLRPQRVNYMYYRDYLVSCIAGGAQIDEVPDSVDISAWPIDVCYADGNVVFDLGFKETGMLHNSVSMVSCKDVEFYLDTKFRKWLKSAPKTVAPATTSGEDIVTASSPRYEGGLGGDDYVLFADTMPQFTGGVEALLKQISSSLHYPETDFYMEREGKVVLSYVVETNGVVGDVAVIKGVTPTIDREAVRVLRSLCCWKPGMKDGKPVRVLQSLPVIFKIADIQIESK